MKNFILILFLLLAAGCSTIILQPADFSWPVESVLLVNDKGFINEERHSFEINVKPIFYEEFQDSNYVVGKEIRIICNKDGYFYFTGTGFKNVYQFTPIVSGLKLNEKINISDSISLKSPAFNQKINAIELVDGTNKYLINGSEIVRVK